MRIARLAVIAICVMLCGIAPGYSQQIHGEASVLSGRVELPKSKGNERKLAVVAWLNNVDHSATIASPQPQHFKLLQKNRMFSPHLLVVPVGSVVDFPNADPFFHNVFSLFNGKRFDLGLYEAGSTKEVTFSREGVSYIFCNIHPEMSAIVVALATPWHATADPSAHFVIEKVPPGDYDLHIWIEGTPQPALDRLTRRIHVRQDAENAVIVDASNSPRLPDEHLNKFGKPYERESGSPY